MGGGLNIWITRTDSSAGASAKTIASVGLTPVAAPLLTLVPASTPDASPPPDCALAFTSANGVRAFTALTDRRDWPVYAVGPATASMAIQAGFTHVHQAGGDVEALGALIISSGELPVVHMSGVHVAGDLVGALEAAGMLARRTIIYATDAVKELPELARVALDNSGSLAVFLYSPKGAMAFLQVMHAAQMEACFERLHIVSISLAVDQVLGGNLFKTRHIAADPNEPAMIEIAQRLSLEISAAKA